MTMPVRELILLGENRLQNAGIEEAKETSRRLYCYMFDLTNTQLIMEWQKSIASDYCEKYFSLLDRRAEGEPLQYITGVQEFMGIPIGVNTNVLIPRLDTEVVVEKALKLIEENKVKTVLDLCCGSGAIGIAVGSLGKNLKVTCSDLSKEALEVAKGNVEKLGLGKVIDFKGGDLFQPFKKTFSKKKFDMIISNPPYIPKDVIPTLMREVKDFEPMSALAGGEDGLDFYRRIALEAGDYLNKKGIIVLEIGHDQGESVPKLLEEAGFVDIEVSKDLAGLDRVVIGRKGK